MKQLIKRDFIMFWSLIGLAYFFIIIVYLLKLPETNLAFYTSLYILFIASTFYYDQADKVNCFLISLPIKRNYVVLARYLFIILNSTLFLLIDRLLFRGSSALGITLMFMFTLLSITIAVSLPLYYLFNSIWKSVVANFIALLIGSFAFVLIMVSPYTFFDPVLIFILELIDLQPFIMLFLISGIFLYGSYVLSSFLFSKRNIV